MRLKEVRIEKGLSVPRLSELSGVPRRTIQDIEKRGDCMVSTLMKLAPVLGVSLDEMCASSPAEKGKAIEAATLNN